MVSRVNETCLQVTTKHYKDWYKVVDGVAIYTHTQYLGSTTEEECESYWLPDLNVSGGGGAGIYIKSSPSSIYEDCSGSDCKYLIDDGEVPFLVDNPVNPIADMQEYLECLSSSQNATLTIYVDEPNPGSGDVHVDGIVGHAYISITQGTNTSTFGFYPTEDKMGPIFNESSDSIIGEDDNTYFSTSLTTNISGNQLQQIINYSTNFNPTYHLDNYNCTDFVIGIGNIGGLNLSDAYDNWTGGGGSNPVGGSGLI